MASRSGETEQSNSGMTWLEKSWRWFKRWLGRFKRWFKRWRAFIGALVILGVIGAAWCIFAPTESNTVVVGLVGAGMTVFVGVLGRNNSRDQAEQAQKRADRQAGVQQREMLMQRQAAAITHMGDPGAATRALAVGEMVWLIIAWSNLADREGGDVWETEAEDHCQELIETAYTPPAALPVTQARADGLRTLGEKLPKNHLTQLDLYGAYLRAARLRAADLSDLELHCANLCGADLAGAYLGGADLTDAILFDGTVYHKTLTSMELNPANLPSKKLNPANLSGAKYDAKTVFPDGSRGKDNKWIVDNRDIAGGMVFIEPETETEQK